MIDWQQITTYIPIVAILSIVVFFIRFFGKVIADQTPFADDRKWLEEISGVKFFTEYILSPFIWCFLWYSRGWMIWLFPKEDIWLFVISLVSIIIVAVVRIKSFDFIVNDDFDEGNIALFFKKIYSTKEKIKLNKGDWMVLLKFVILSVNTIFIIILMLYFYKRQAYYHLAAAFIYLFNHLIIFALLTSLNKRNILMANIEFINKQTEPIINCRIIKVNDDNVKIKFQGKGALINKTIISKIEFIKKDFNIKTKENNA